MQGRFRRLCCLATGCSGASADVSYRGAIGEGRAKSNHGGDINLKADSNGSVQFSLRLPCLPHESLNQLQCS